MTDHSDPLEVRDSSGRIDPAAVGVPTGSEPRLIEQTAAARGRGPLATRIGSFRHLPLKAKIGIVILSIYILIAIIGPWIAPYDPNATSTQAVPLAPTIHHLLGTSATGGDVLSQILVGTRSTVVLGLMTGVIATVLAVVVGTAAGYLGGWADEFLSLFSNVFLVIPAL
ncbi:MAG TPA: hypothetical protein VME01_09945, partial [Solirubrobacteraceae bacterium]|nr:hypothetical protein [Solirubrobacteraceae bacterium]